MQWDVDRGETTRTFTEHIADVMSLTISPRDSNLFVSGSCDTFAKLWDVRQDKCAMSFGGHEVCFYVFIFSLFVRLNSSQI